MITRVDRLEFVHRWKREIVHTSYVPLHRSDIDELLTDCLDRLLGELTGAALPGEALEVGAQLVQIHFTNPEALSRTVRLFAAELPRMLPDLRRDRLFAAIGDLTAGFAGRLREQTLAEQEVIKQAVLHARDAAEEALRASEARTRAVFTSSALGIAVVSLDGTIEEVNAALTRIFQHTTGELVGGAVFDLVDEPWLGQLQDATGQLAAGELDRCQLETRRTEPNGTHIWTQVSGSLVRDAQGEPDYQVLLYEDITDRHMLQEQFRRQATHDPLTGLANRTQLESSLDAALEPAYPGRRVGLCYFDLDGFKAVNDSLGHPIGDRLLRQVAQRLDALAKAELALAARMGGDEFVVLVPDSRDANSVIELVDRLLREINRPVRIGDHELSASASVGIVEREVADTDAEALLRDADITLYRAKSDGRAQWVLFDAVHNAVALDRFKLSAALPAALEQNELFVEYEPIKWLQSDKLVGATGNVRWDHPEFGELDADRFLALAEETGLITRLGSWALEQVCEQAARWVQRLGEDAPIAAVNLSPRHCRDPELVADVRRILHKTGLPAQSLALGLPEAALFDHNGDPVDTLEIFAEMGIRLVVYEFGDDYTGVGRLRDLPITGVRIDGPHLASLADPDGPDPLGRHLVSSTVGAAKLMGFPVLVGGVRTALQAQRLEELGVCMVQGPYVSELASASEIEQLFAESG
ncbi:EAL domain-containing protein [Saccharopolyspora sp. K220]|uniref:putative bifunctional diguanylate cyclase/phosphodiesterase n=1 Tax=Saccharopolyspora soli TaxID=2926618 RepID=UPI001F5992F7|nr:EAL domain-containing protein [Saccharopolyspora soli]MCI2420128.1 EAL domain-containing protein [Saccharopolyspora soli]